MPETLQKDNNSSTSIRDADGNRIAAWVSEDDNDDIEITRTSESENEWSEKNEWHLDAVNALYYGGW